MFGFGKKDKPSDEILGNSPEILGEITQEELLKFLIESFIKPFQDYYFKNKKCAGYGNCWVDFKGNIKVRETDDDMEYTEWEFLVNDVPLFRVFRGSRKTTMKRMMPKYGETNILEGIGDYQPELDDAKFRKDAFKLLTIILKEINNAVQKEIQTSKENNNKASIKISQLFTESMTVDELLEMRLSIDTLIKLKTK